MDLIAHQIRDGIVRGAFRPGQQLGEARLATQLGMSRGPVREALQRLVQEGLLVSIVNRGVFVKSLDDDDIRDIMLARTAIEKSAAAALMRSQDETTLRRLDDVVGRMEVVAQDEDWPEMVQLDLEFHGLIVESCHSTRLSAMYGTLIIETRISLMMLDGAYVARERIPQEHRELLAAIRGKDAASLYAAIDEHMDHATQLRLGELTTARQTAAGAPAEERTMQ